MRQGRRKEEDDSSTAVVGDPENSEKLTECLSDWPEGQRLEAFAPHYALSACSRAARPSRFSVVCCTD